MTLLGEYVSAGDIILNGILTLAVISIIWSLWSLHRKNGRYSNFNLFHLIVNKDGYPDGAKFVEMGVFLLMAWGFIVQVTKGTLAEWYVVAFVGAFVTRGAFGAYLRSKGDPPDAPGTKVTTEVVTTAKTTEVTPSHESKGDK